MLKNYFKIAWRNLLREKSYTLINISSLAVGIACVLFLLLLDQYAYNFDSFHEKGDRIHRVNDRIITESGSELNAGITPWPWAEAIAEEFPEVESYTRFRDLWQTVGVEDEVFQFDVNYVDETFFDLFTFPLAKGEAASALAGPNRVVLTQPVAETLFGSEDPMGRFVRIEGKGFEVTGVLEKMPEQSSISLGLVVSSANLTKQNFPDIDNWKTHNIYTYLLLSEGADPERVEARFPEFLKNRIDEDAASRYTPWLQPYESMYLGGELYGNHGETLDVSYIYIFSSLAFLVLLISCINFINLSTARASRRNVEVGIRKVIGAAKPQLIFQYLFEVLLIVVMSVSVSLLLVEWALPWFNAMTDWAVDVDYMRNFFFLASAAGIILFVTLMAGSYPALYLTRFNPTDIFRSRGSAAGSSWLRSSLVVSQFVLAIFLLVSSRVVDRQISYLYSKDLGYNEENVIQAWLPDEAGPSDVEALKQELLRDPEIQSVALASNSPFSSGNMIQYNVEGSEWEEGRLISTFSVDPDFLSLMEMELIAGRTFDESRSSDTAAAYVINSTAARTFGWDPAEAVGRTVVQPRSQAEDLQGTVIGVIKDFHFESLQREIQPLVMRYRPNDLRLLYLKSGSGNLDAATATLETQWKAFFPGEFLDHYVLQHDLATVYRLEEIIGSMLSLLTWLTIFIACLGLLGLASYSISQRTKEIGIRKILGADVRGIITMLSRDFMKYVIIAIAVSVPLAWWAVNQWLQNFAYHTSVGFSTIAFTVGITMLVAFLTICWQAVRAARANPVHSLRSE